MVIFVQTDYTGTQTAIFEALDAVGVDRAELPRGRKRQHTNPYRAVTSFEEPVNFLSGELRVLSQLPVLPTRETFESANPKGAVPGDKQRSDEGIGKGLSGRRLPGDGASAILLAEEIVTSGQAEPIAAAIAAQPPW